MGLDMNLYREVVVGSTTLLEPKENREISYGGGGELVLRNELCYWRKFNALHNYFVENFGEGVDNNQRLYLSIDDIKLLYDRLRQLDKTMKYDVKSGKILNPEICAEMLPTCEGFYFGSTEYDKDYYEQVGKTVMMLASVLADHSRLLASGVKQFDTEYFYVASW